MKKTSKLLIISSVILMSLLVFPLLARPKTLHANQTIDHLNERLDQMGELPVSFKIMQEKPLQLQVTIRFESERVSPLEQWYLMLVEREIKLLFLDGYSVEAYQTVADKPSGKEVINLITYIYPDQIKERLFDKSAQYIDDLSTENIVRELINKENTKLTEDKAISLLSVKSTTGIETQSPKKNHYHTDRSD